MNTDRRSISDFSDLQIWQKAYTVSLEIHHLVEDFPAFERFELGRQMRRASKGICANIAEGYGKQHLSKAEFKRFLLMAIGSADEMRVWLRYANDLGYLHSSEQYHDLSQQYQAIAKMLNRLQQNWH